MKDLIAYVGPFSFPWGQAASRRVCGVALSLANAGYEVVVAGGDDFPNRYEYLGDEGAYRSIRFIGLGEYPSNSISVRAKLVRLLWSWGARTVDWLDSLPIKPRCVVVYGGGAQYLLRLIPWCRKNKVKLIVDVVEWYDPRQMTGGRFGPFYLSNVYAREFLYQKCDGLIAISSLLEQHYLTHGCRVIRVPPTLDTRGFVLREFNRSGTSPCLSLLYAGNPGNKDLLANVINGIERVDPKGARIKLLILGPSLDQVLRLLNRNELPLSINVLGRVPQDKVIDYFHQAHFSVFLREPARFSNAGFPTKFVESFAYGTPVIANLTSDLGNYLHEGVEGLICADHTTEAFEDALERALKLTEEQLLIMKRAARRLCEVEFDFRAYSENISSFIQDI